MLRNYKFKIASYYYFVLFTVVIIAVDNAITLACDEISLNIDDRIICNLY